MLLSDSRVRITSNWSFQGELVVGIGIDSNQAILDFLPLQMCLFKRTLFLTIWVLGFSQTWARTQSFHSFFKVQLVPSLKLMRDVEPMVLLESELGAGGGLGVHFLGWILFFFSFYFFAVPRGTGDLSSLTRDRTRAPCSGSAES